MCGLKETAILMVSDDYKDRFKAEYYQLTCRIEKLNKMIVKYDAGTLSFEPTCSIELLKEQLGTMREYQHILRVRAEIEGITL